MKIVAIVFKDFFTKWPMVYPAPEKKATHIAELLVKQMVPAFGVPEALYKSTVAPHAGCIQTSRSKEAKYYC